MILLTVNFGFHVIAIFMLYKLVALDSWYHGKTFDLEINALSYVISITWHTYYASVSMLVIVSGALLSRHVMHQTSQLLIIQSMTNNALFSKGRKTGVFVHKRLHKVNEKGTCKEVRFGTIRT